MENNKKRKLKYLYQRMPDEKVGFDTLKRQLHERTGFAIKDIDEVIYELGELIQEKIIEKKSVYIPKIGTLFPTIKPGKNVVKINKFKNKGAELMYMPERWVCKFKVKPSFAQRLLEINPTEQEINNIYKD